MVRARGNLTYRLRRLPNYLERSTVANFLVNSVEGLGPPENILIFSLASNLVPWERPPTKTATLMFKKTPERFDNDQTEWTVSVLEQGQSLIFDTHFLEFTPLSDCDRDVHEFDCIAISGLASHPLGSWMHRKSQSNFVWLRDRLPKDMPGIRPIIYGYDTQLVQSESVQTVDDLASSFIARLASIGKVYTSAKPLIVIVHSLGGILLKSALVQMASSLGEEGSILSSIKMIIFFGVPSRGMHMSHLLPMVKGQPNEHLVQLLSPDSDYLSSLNHHFSGIATICEIRLISAYETKLSRTTQVTEAGTWERTGPYELLVDKQSAIQADTDPKNCFPINEDHSDMVKFADDSPEYRIVIGFLDTLIQVVRPDPAAVLESQQFRSSKERASVAPSQTGRSKRPKFLNVMASASTAGLSSYEPATQIQPESSKRPRRRGRKSAINTETSSREANLQRERTEKQKNLKELHDSLEFVERSHRYDKITQPHQTTFNWIFENSDLGLVQWLRKGSGIYWIQGKPGSGKSTLMKFLHDSPRTSEILTRWRQGRGQMSAWFFFNERGSYIEKSFEGLFRSIIRELISENGQLAELVLEVYLDRVKQTSKQKQTWHVQDLEYALSAILSQRQQDLDVLLFLDALDEYSGPPEMIAEFVQSLVQTTTDSKTKLKVLFSSRPWDAFVASFGRCPGFKMHEQTEGDMRVFVLDQLGAIPTATPSLSPPNASVDSPSRDIVSTIVDRAEGVFLWVKLVTESLVEAGPNATTLQLERLLQALPDGLQELYERTIERIPGSSRLEVFIVIEIVNRTLEPMTVLEVVLAASCALGKTFQDCVDATRKRLSGMDFQQEALRLKNLCGGLIDAGHSSADSTVQFMHQTVKDFVNRPGFEHRILGCSHAPLYQNGFSFLFKYELAMLHIARSSSQDRLPPGIPRRQAAGSDERVTNILHNMPTLARLAERTTGSNQETFLDSIGDSGIQSLFGSLEIDLRILSEIFPYRSIVPDSVLSFAVYGDLLLYTRQKLQNTDIFKDSPRNSLLHFAAETSIVFELRAPTMIELLLNNRANIHHMLGGETPFQHLMTAIQRRRIIGYPHGNWSRLSKVVEVFLKHGQDANVDIPHSPSESLGGASKKFSKALHIAGNEVSKTLLEHGAHVNALDSDGLTALDRLIGMPTFSDYVNPKYLAEMYLGTGSILLEHGGCITHSTENKQLNFLHALGSYDVDIPEALRNPPRLQGWLARRLRGLVPTFLGGE